MDEVEPITEEVIEQVRRLPAVQAGEAVIARGELSVAEVVAQKDKIRQVMEAVMVPGTHYGIIPGVSKPSLFKPGAEAINVALRLAPHYESEKIWHEDGHLTVVTKCILRHIPTDLVIATGEGLCTTREERYAYRQAKRRCPNCGAEAIIRGKPEYGGGWVCWKKEGGCGSTFPVGSEEIESQPEGKVPNPSIADTYNTVLKMAGKRSLIAAVLNGTAASDVFTQDVEDQPVAATVETVRRVEGPPPLPLPRSWQQIKEYVSAYDEDTYKTFTAFGEAARRRLFPKASSSKDLTKEERDELFRRTARAAHALRESVDAAGFPPPSTDEVRQAWATAMDGELLALEGEE
ncbi:MAG: hypothetical protein KatS3mg015_2474 [Fimbriimonadales bacterium]|nr:MAG: hypothetical protein KatS3mg015_2474 [Fimbriimonadales bacterium]